MQRRYISREGLANLADYKYHGIDNSTLARLFLNDWWNFVVSYVPLWVAPNVITLVGFLIILANYSAIADLSDAKDNIDGKHARRTKASSPLGELFDHGCDSLFVTIAGVSIPWAFGASPWFGFVMLHVGYLAFYYAHWEEYHTGILILGPIANPTEIRLLASVLVAVQCLMSSVLLFTAFVGVPFWSQLVRNVVPAVILCPAVANALPAVVADSALGEALVGGCFLIVFALLFWSAQEVLRAAKAKHIGPIEACGPLAPLFVNLIAGATWFYFSPTKIMHHYPLATYTFYGVIVSYLLIKLILARIVKVEFYPWEPILLLPFAGAYYAVFLRHVYYLSEVQLFVGLFAIAVVMHLHLSYGIMKELTKHLKIRAFSIPYPPPN